MKVLFSAFEFPPLATPGVRRPLGFIQYLPEFGVQPLVLTTDRDSYINLGLAPLDDSLLERLPAETEIRRVPCPSPRRHVKGKFRTWLEVYFAIQERYGRGWAKRINTSVEEILRNERPDVIYVTLPPWFMGPLWCKVAKRYDIPLVLDLRDAWSQWRVGPYSSWIHYYLTLKMERKALLDADLILTTSDQTRADLLKLHSVIPDRKISVVHNGYDQSVMPFDSSSIAPTEGRFSIGYVGNFYYFPKARDAMMTPWWKKRIHRMAQFAPRKEDWLYRSPYFFFKAVSQLLSRCPELRNRLRVRLAGVKPAWLQAQIDEFRLQDIVESVGHLSATDVVKFQRSCDALLITSSKVIGGRDYSIAGKTFEYFTMNKPIVAFVCDGAQRDILEPSGLAMVCNPDDAEESSRQLERLMRGNVRLSPDASYISRFHRREGTRRLAELLSQLHSERSEFVRK